MIALAGSVRRISAIRVQDDIFRRLYQRRRLGILLLLLALTACSNSGGVNDLKKFVSQARMQKGKVEPLPEFKPAETFVYGAAETQDPFAIWQSEIKPAARATSMVQGIRPNVNRRKEILENYPLDTLRLTGFLEYGQQRWGLVKAPDDIIYRVRIGNYLGENYGKVTQVLENRLVLMEIIPDGLGGWEEHQAALSVDTKK